MNAAIRVRHLPKTFHSQTKSESVRALDNVSLDVFSGEILGVLGPNGAGKTTFLNIISTLLLPDNGIVEILGVRSVPRNYHYIRSVINMSSGYPNYPWSLTVEENLKFYGRLYGLPEKENRVRIGRLIEMFQLEEFVDTRFDELSSGTKQRLSLAKALINNP